ncbi:hypothetical protein GTA08_BOTSDO07290 [Botryosphaeria dothidea]|uniref:Uncharacterized protein n=1 Tax=Botryosphaeria dothidea TaxID=55169 RepID=A0A8H4N7Q9_9PEZI|nr:hypothetical protein GTA08_BOTSDO11482 [Botryosphaeria dothidea]KAF4305757.1 hypothetical protein GTA08_BOTSDO07290 [Botryosphaeria dothidea]
MVPTTEMVNAGSIKYYVACYSVMNLCDMRLISSDAIFFFSEIWSGISTELEVKLCRVAIGSACKIHAASVKGPSERVKTVIERPQDPTASNALAVTKDTNTANGLLIQYSIWRLSMNDGTLEALQRTVKRAMPDLANKPSNEGTVAFYDFESALEKNDAQKLIQEVKGTYPNVCSLDVDLIINLHAALRKDDLGNQLPYQSLAPFLGFVHDRASASWEPDMLEQVVRQILHDIKILNKTRYTFSVSTVSELADDSEDLAPFVSSVRQTLLEIRDFLLAQATELREQHGGIQRHISTNDLMVKIGNCVDKTALMVLEEQVFAIHAEQLATRNGRGVDYIDELIQWIDVALGSR